MFGENNNNISFINTSQGTYTIQLNDNTKQPTRLEQFTKSQNDKIEKAERFEEYLELQCQLSSYFSAVKNLEKQ